MDSLMREEARDWIIDKTEEKNTAFVLMMMIMMMMIVLELFNDDYCNVALVLLCILLCCFE